MRKSQNLKYEVDPTNRLVLAKTGEESRVPKFRQVLDGTFKIDKNNTLIYHVKSASPRSIPRQIKLSGNWSLNPQHNLVLTLNNEREQYAGDALTLSSELIDAKSDKLEFSLTAKDADGKTHFYILRLAGRWQADKYNRLSFLVTKSRNPSDEITLSGAWEVNKKNQLVYTYIGTVLKTKKKLYRAITFKGFWDISEKFRVSYVLNKELNSGFDFQVSLGKPAKRGLEYEIGIGAMPAKKKFSLLGSWKVNEKLGLLFEMPYAEGKVRSLLFGATCKLNKDYTLDMKLKNDLHQDLGINVKLGKIILKDQGEAFLQTLKEGKEIALVAGMGFRW